MTKDTIDLCTINYDTGMAWPLMFTKQYAGQNQRPGLLQWRLPGHRNSPQTAAVGATIPPPQAKDCRSGRYYSTAIGHRLPEWALLCHRNRPKTAAVAAIKPPLQSRVCHNGGCHATARSHRSQHQHSILGHIDFMFQYHKGNC